MPDQRPLAPLSDVQLGGLSCAAPYGVADRYELSNQYPAPSGSAVIALQPSAPFRLLGGWGEKLQAAAAGLLDVNAEPRNGALKL
jgi:hypothetical protein